MGPPAVWFQATLGTRTLARIAPKQDSKFRQPARRWRVLIQVMVEFQKPRFLVKFLAAVG